MEGEELNLRNVLAGLVTVGIAPFLFGAGCEIGKKPTPAASATAAQAALCPQPTYVNKDAKSPYVTEATVRDIMGPCYSLGDSYDGTAVFHSELQGQPYVPLDIRVTVTGGKEGYNSWTFFEDAPGYDHLDGKFHGVLLRKAQASIGSINACVCNSTTEVGAFLSIDLGNKGTVLNYEQRKHYLDPGAGGTDSRLLQLVGKITSESDFRKLAVKK